MDKKEKRNAGRPKVVRDLPPIRGILSEPANSENCIEFVYSMPIFIKYLWQIFKKMNADKNYITFQKDRIVVNCHASHGKSSMRCIFDCTKVSSYYCEEEMSIIVDCADFTSITKKIDVKFNDFQLYCQRDNRHSIVVKLTPANGIIENYNINLTEEYEELPEIDHGVCDHMVLVKIGVKYLKRTLTEFKRNVRVMSFKQEDVKSPVFMSFKTIDGSVDSEYEIPRETDDNMKKKEPQAAYVSNIPEDHIFRVQFLLDYLRPFLSSMPNEVINIYLDEQKPIKMDLKSPDESLSICVLISLVDDELD